MLIATTGLIPGFFTISCLLVPSAMLGSRTAKLLNELLLYGTRLIRTLKEQIRLEVLGSCGLSLMLRRSEF